VEGGGEFKCREVEVCYGGGHDDLLVQLERRLEISALADVETVAVDFMTIIPIIWILTGKERVETERKGACNACWCQLHSLDNHSATLLSGTKEHIQLSGDSRSHLQSLARYHARTTQLLSHLRENVSHHHLPSISLASESFAQTPSHDTRHHTLVVFISLLHCSFT
jgi:hypothetical protein